MPGTVVLLPSPASGDHNRATAAVLAQWLAALKGYDYGGVFDPGRHHGLRRYFVPAQTLVSEEAAALGIAGEEDFFGGVVPHAFVATKAITHPLHAVGAASPAGWSAAFPGEVTDVVLFGFAAFSREDARAACRRVMERGRVRLKLAGADGGRGQRVIAAAGGLEGAIAGLDGDLLSRSGVVIEEDLTEPVTYSVGRVRVGDHLICYCGTQSVTPDGRGGTAYGGSSLLVVRGGFSQLLEANLTWQARLAVTQAEVYDGAADRCFPGFMASRRNYDVIQGVDSAGRWRSAVLEQSWRLGGATGAELIAMAALADDPALVAVRASCRESYDPAVTLPDHALVYYRGVDKEAGALTKWAVIEERYHAL